MQYGAKYWKRMVVSQAMWMAQLLPFGKRKLHKLDLNRYLFRSSNIHGN